MALTELKAELGLPFSLQTLCRALQALQFTFKKVLCATEQDRPEIAERRSLWRTWQGRLTVLDLRRFVFLHEPWEATNMCRRYGRSRRGERLIAAVPHGNCKSTTFVAALHFEGPTAPLVVEGAMNGRIFLAYIQQQLVRTLRAGDILVIDNLAAHKIAGVCEAIERVGARVAYFPPYSPDLNPLDLEFSTLKWLTRSAAE